MSQFSLTWDSYKSNICGGFSALQQNGEFVDMTIAADGHLVKVHQVLIALASPYLKDLIASAPCQHPVVFLNNISHKVLCYILEYIYTGEVIVPSDSLHLFTAAAKSLYIKGLEGIANEGYPKDQTGSHSTDLNESSDFNKSVNVSAVKRRALQPVDTSDQLMLPKTARKVMVKTEQGKRLSQSGFDIPVIDNPDPFPELDEPMARDSDEEFKVMESHQNTDGKVKAATSLQFTVSIRGSLQIILNRYIYNLNTSMNKGQSIRKWRCVDYRNLKCAAFVVTKGNVVVNRGNPHNHPFHDKKILSKIQKQSVFSAIDEVEAYRDNKKEMENEATVIENVSMPSFDNSFIDCKSDA